jgi:DnaJ-domain-containing protein 1
VTTAAEVDATHQRRINLYEVLQVSATACPEVVQAAYRALARSYHPDVNPSEDAARQMRQLNAAYGVLSDPARRARYDAMRVRPMRARRETHAESRPSNTTRVAPRPVYVRAVPHGVIPPLPRSGSPRVGRLLAALVFVLFFIGVMVYGLFLLAGALEDEPMRAMVPNSAESWQTIDGPASPSSGLNLPPDIRSSALSHVGEPRPALGR